MDKSKNIVSVTLEDSYTRTYPYGTMASDVIGFTSSGNSGTIGLEAYYNNELNGTDGKKNRVSLVWIQLRERSEKPDGRQFHCHND